MEYCIYVFSFIFITNIYKILCNRHDGNFQSPQISQKREVASI